MRLLPILAASAVLPLLVGCPKPPPAQGGDGYQSQIQWKPYNGKKMRLAIMDFENRSGYGGMQFARTAQKMLATALTSSGHFDVFEGDAIKSVLAQQAFQNSGLTNAEGATKIGGMVNAQFVVLGTITELGEIRDKTQLGTVSQDVLTYWATVDISVINTQTSQTIISGSQTATISDKTTRIGLVGGKSTRSDDSRLNQAIRDSIDKVALQLVEKTPTSGFDYQIANVDAAGKVTINGGQGDFQPGQQLKVFRRGKEVLDPATGAHLDWEETEIGVIEVVEVKASVSYCRIVKGRSFAAQDVVRP
jgi:curli biogenesis system outer membrane secretion channel CsgG